MKIRKLYGGKKPVSLKGAKKPFSLILAVALLLTVVIGGTIAWLAANSGPVTNAFTPAYVTSEVNETFLNNIKSDVKIENTGNIDAYIRVALVPTWENEDKSVAPVTASLSDLYIVWGDTYNADWFLGSDGYYYFKAPVAEGYFTSILIKSATVNNNATSQKYKMNLQILCEAIQSVPASAVESAWPVTVTGTTLSAKP